jgi:hypothetical protein
LPGQWASTQPGRDDQPIEARRSRVEQNGATTQIQGFGAHADPMIDAMFEMELRRSKRKLRRRHATVQHSLGKRRPVVSRMPLTVHKHQLAREPSSRRVSAAVNPATDAPTMMTRSIQL